MILFSVIIPHYNSVAQLNRLIESIPVNDCIQLIVIDDKSTENTATAEQKVIAKGGLFLHNTTPVKGAGTCRNLGLEQAAGKWLVFADADDYFLDGAFDILKKYSDAKEDIIYFSPTSRYSDSGKTAQRHIPFEKLVHHYIETPSGDNEILLRYKFMVPWSKMIRNQIVQKNHITFDEVPASNDVMFSMKTAYHAASVSVSDEQIYCVTCATDTLTTKRSEANYRARLAVFIDRYHYLKTHLDMKKYGFVLPSGILFITEAVKQGYSPSFIWRIYLHMKKHHIPMVPYAKIRHFFTRVFHS